MIPPTTQPAQISPGGQQDLEHVVVLHDNGECYQPPKTLRSGCQLGSNLDHNIIFILEIGPIQFLGLDLIDPQSRLLYFDENVCHGHNVLMMPGIEVQTFLCCQAILYLSSAS